MQIFRKRNLALLFAFSLLGFLVMGYHPGIEDDGVYLSAIKCDLNPALYHHDAEFFQVQLQATMFDKWVAGFIEITHIPIAATELLWQVGSIVLMLAGCWCIARTLFEEARAQWAAVAMVGAMLTLPVAGTALYLADQHLHPRNIATALILIAISRIQLQRIWQAVPLLLLSFVLHPIMGVLGISFAIFLTVAQREPVHVWLRSLRNSLAAAVPLGWIFEPPTQLWRKALATRSYLFLYRWTWYEWLGAIGPLVLFWILLRFAQKRSDVPMARFALAVFVYGVFQQVTALVILGSPSLVRLTPMQPMRYLHLIYVFMALVAGGLFGKYLVKTSVWRWAVFLVAINAGMFAAQRALFSSSEHLELPGRRSANPWLQAFAWIRINTPTDAYFALDPLYLAAPNEDYHSFRALAERSQLADSIKDTAVVTQVPELGPAWAKQVAATANWRNFKLSDFQRLKSEFGIDWVLVSYPAPRGLGCRWHNESLTVCQIPN
ncbi:MAG TPA: hypothetical protein VE291_03275 [Terracidiphilus sp.]|nr:hypothetical protein [Terracidiphilus sp.]